MLCEPYFFECTAAPQPSTSTIFFLVLIKKGRKFHQSLCIFSQKSGKSEPTEAQPSLLPNSSPVSLWPSRIFKIQAKCAENTFFLVRLKESFSLGGGSQKSGESEPTEAQPTNRRLVFVLEKGVFHTSFSINASEFMISAGKVRLGSDGAFV